jgi:hypothetical protein
MNDRQGGITLGATDLLPAIRRKTCSGGGSLRHRHNDFRRSPLWSLRAQLSLQCSDFDDADIHFVDPSPVLTTLGTTHPER